MFIYRVKQYPTQFYRFTPRQQERIISRSKVQMKLRSSQWLFVVSSSALPLTTGCETTGLSRHETAGTSYAALVLSSPSLQTNTITPELPTYLVAGKSASLQVAL